MSEQIGSKIHNVILEQRQKLNMSGVIEVVSFDDDTIILKTVAGGLTLRGENLHIGAFSTSTGEIDINGKIIAFIYTGEESARGGFFKKLLK